MIFIQLLVCRAVAEISIVNFYNFLVIWDKVALDESDIVHRLTQNTLLPDTEYFENVQYKTDGMRPLCRLHSKSRYQGDSMSKDLAYARNTKSGYNKESGQGM